MRGRWFSVEDLERIEEAFKEGIMASKLAREMRCSYRCICVHYAKLRNGEPLRRHYPQKPRHLGTHFYGPADTIVSPWFIDTDGCRTRTVSA